jgi:hypothetical protein
MHGEKMNAYSVVVGKPEGKRPLGKFKCTWIILKLILEK